ncbi:MAG: hypothetical protein WCF17_11965 [Terracidiphilus sp.]
MSRKTAKEVVLLLGLPCVIAYAIYSGVTGTGFYRWLVDLNLRLQGNGPYDVYTMLLMIPMFAFSLGILFAICSAAGWVIDRLPFTPATGSDAPAAAAAANNRADAPDVLRARKALVVFFLVLSVALMVVGGRVGLIAYRKTNPSVTFEPLNLADGVPPRTTHVKLTGVAVPSMEMRYGESNRYDTRWEAYIPVLPPHWRQGDPVVYFLHPEDSEYLQHSKPVMISQTGVLIPDGLPGPAAFLFKKHGIALGTPPIVLDTDPEADLDPLIETAAWCVGAGLLLLGVFGSLTVSWARARIRGRRLAS